MQEFGGGVVQVLSNEESEEVFDKKNRTWLEKDVQHQWFLEYFRVKGIAKRNGGIEASLLHFAKQLCKR